MIDIMSGVLLASAYPLESGQMHSKQSGRYEVVQTLPKETDSATKMFTYARAEGNLRMAYIHNSYAAHHNSALSVGGRFGFRTASYRGVNLHVNATTSQRIALLNPKKSDHTLAHDFFDATGDSFTYISHANVQYNSSSVNLKAGRFTLNTPYLDADDIRMAANSFEGGSLSYRMGEKVMLNALYVTRWAGYDSGENQHKFTPLTENGSGVGALGMTYMPDDEHSASVWYYHADAMSHIFYVEYSGHYNIADDFHIEYGLQGSYMAAIENSQVEGIVFGAMGIVDYGPMFLGLSYNRAGVNENEHITNGFGGGPYYTSLDEATLGALSEHALGEDVMAYRVGIGYEVKRMGLVIEGVYGNLRSRHNEVNVKESDLILTYTLNDALLVKASVMSYHMHDGSSDVKRGMFRVDYKF